MAKGKKLESFRTAYKNYKARTGWYSPLNVNEYVEFMNGFAELMMEKILEGKTVYVPEKLGAIQVVGKKLQPKVTENGIEGLTPNWIATKQLWRSCKECEERNQKVYYFNEHSDGIRYRFMWSRTAMLLGNKWLYTYVPNRKSKKKLASCIHNGVEYQLLEGRFALKTKTINALKNKNI